MSSAPAASAQIWCVVRAGQRNWRLPAAEVVDVVFWPMLTRVPLQPRRERMELLGVFAWQQEVVPVVDVSGLSADERRRVVIARGRAGTRDVLIEIAASDAAVADDAGSAELLAVSDLAAHLMSGR